MKIQDFNNTGLCNYASYSTIRQLAGYVDGLKNGSRKVVFTILEQNIKSKLKVLQLSNKCAEYADYLHGSLDGVVVSLGANYVGANNLPLVQSYGNFGSRLAPENAAPRYIFGHGHDNLFKLFDANDNAILDYQTFEGNRIEPKFYTPNLPMLLVNGSIGLATGFAQSILPRKPENLAQYCKKYIEGALSKKDLKLLVPYVKGFNGTFEQDKDNPCKWYVKGKIIRKDKTHLLITEMPLNYDLKSAIKLMDKLVDSKVIEDYDDMCDTKADTFTFLVKMRMADLDKFTEEQLLDKLKLIQPVTENFTSLDENLKVREFKSAEEIIDAYMKIKLVYNQKRKEYLISKLGADINLANSKMTFIKAIIDGTLVISKKKKDIVIKELEGIKGIIKKDDSYDYLLNMPLYSLTKERLDKLQEAVSELKGELQEIKGKTPEMIFLDDLENI